MENANALKLYVLQQSCFGHRQGDMTWRVWLHGRYLPGGPLKTHWNKLSTTWTAWNGNRSRCCSGHPTRELENRRLQETFTGPTRKTNQQSRKHLKEKKGQQTAPHHKSLDLWVWPRKYKSNKLRQALLQQKVGETDRMNVCVFISKLDTSV